MHPQEIVLTALVVVLRVGNDPFLIMRIWEEYCGFYAFSLLLYDLTCCIVFKLKTVVNKL